MIALTQVQCIELFHLLFLAHAGQSLDKRCYALKGGCNLRFFFGSIRYSEDMDFDVQGLSTEELRSRVNRVLEAKAFRQALAVRAMEIEHVTESKQTKTTQRWKFGLFTPAAPLPSPTKIEFSRRAPFSDAVFGSVDPAILRVVGVPPVLVSHYAAGPAWRQKVGALAHRTVTQARDVFDLHLLLASGTVFAARENALLSPDVLREAEKRCLEMNFEDFKGQVLSYLAPEQQPVYDAPGLWDEIALKVAEALRSSHANS
ncbi:MAG: nucleotidyl transferase AbiEii/AbiGii toxin family protein [bacterium]